MRILITGATGFVGNNLLRALVLQDHSIIVLVRDENKIETGFRHKLQLINLNNTGWKEAVQKADPEVVIHLAAYLTSADDEAAIQNLIDANIIFGTQLLHALQSAKSLKYFINTGTFAEYNEGDLQPAPAYLYAATKSAFRNILSYYKSTCNFKIIHVVPYTIYGGIDSKKKLVDHIYDSLSAKEAIKMSPGEQVLDFIHIDDVVAFYTVLLQQLPTITAEEIHLGTGKGTTPKSIANIIKEITGKPANIEWGGLPYRKRDTMYSVANRLLPVETMKWKPAIDIREGLRKYINLIEQQTKDAIQEPAV